MSELVRLDDKPIPDDRPECRAFLVVRDEALRLPYVLDYHRALGVSRFFIIDNVSNDGTLDYVQGQFDCHVYSAAGSFAASNFGIDWVNQLVTWHGEGHWCLSIDADECLVYPDCETVSLPALCTYLQASKADGLFCVMVDMYSDQPIAETVYRVGTPFLDTCRYFDKDYHFRRRTGLRPFPTHEFIGGPRLRCFYGEFMDRSMVGWNVPKIVRSVRSKIGVTSETWGVMPPLLIKIPLIRGGTGLWVSNHKTTNLALADITGALLHFKYFSDFHERVETARAERQHFDAASEYARYDAALRENPNMTFYYSGSRRYSESGDFVRAGFMNTHESYQSHFTADRLVG